MPASGPGRIDPNALNKQIQDWSGPIAAPKPQPQKAPPPSAGPTGFWGRISQIGVGKVNALNAYRAVSNSGPAVKSNNAPVKAVGRGVKAFGKAAVSSEQTVATGIARELPGGTNDLKAQEQASNQAVKDVQFLKDQAKQGKISKPAATKLIQSRANDASQVSKDVNKTVKEMPTKGQLAAGFAGTALDIAGGGTLTKGGKLFKAEKGVEAVKTGQRITKVPEALQAGKKAQVAYTAGAAAGAGAANAKATGASGKQALFQAGAGAAIPLLGAGISKVLQMGPREVLSRVKGAVRATTGKGASEEATVAGKPMQDVMTGAQADRAAAAAKTNIPVADTSAGAEKLGVRTPVRPGVTAISTTDKIGVRTPQRMSDEEFHGEFNKLSKNYDKEVKQVQADVAANPPKPSTPTAKLIKAAKPDQEPLDGYHHSSELINDHADMMKQIEDGAKGGQKVPDGEGGYIRTSEHGQFYRQYYAENGRAPSKAAYVEQAKKELESGKAPYGMSDTYKSLRDRETGKSTEPVTVPLKGDEGTGRMSTRQAVAVRAIDTKYERAMNDLLDRYHNPQLSEKVAPKQIAKQTLKAGKTTGGVSGAPKVPRAKIEPAAGQGGKTGQVRTTTRLSKAPAEANTGRSAGGIFMEAQQTGKPISMSEARNRATAGGETVAGSALNQEARSVEAGVTKELEGKATYNAGSFKQESENAVKLLDKDPEMARAIATGRTPGNNTIHEVAVRRALEARALKDGDVDTLRALAGSSQHTTTSEAGQRLGAEGYAAIHNSPVDMMKEVSDVRAKALEKTGKTVDKAAARAGKEIAAKTKVPSGDDWKVFVESIKC